MEKKGNYIVTVQDDCFRFVDVSNPNVDPSAQNGNQFPFKVGETKVVTLRATAFRISGKVKVEDANLDPTALKGEVQSNFEVRLVPHSHSPLGSFEY